jgi:hypothetical protein
MNYLKEEMIKIGADGVIFHSIGFKIGDEEIPMKIFAEFTIDTIGSVKAFPRSSRTYYKLVNGKRVFYNWESKKFNQ